MIKLYNVRAVAEMLGMSISSVYKRAEKGEIQAVKIGTALRFSEESVQAFVDKCLMHQKNQEVSRDSEINFYDSINEF